MIAECLFVYPTTLCCILEECPEGQIGTSPDCEIPPEAGGGDGEIDGGGIFNRVLDICGLVNGN